MKNLIKYLAQFSFLQNSETNAIYTGVKSKRLQSFFISQRFAMHFRKRKRVSTIFLLYKKQSAYTAFFNKTLSRGKLPELIA